MISNYIHLRKKIVQTKDWVNALSILEVECRSDKASKDRALDPIEVALPRYSLRMLYHAENFVNRILDIVDNRVPRVAPNDTLGLPIGPEIYFEFDAFLYSAKSILERNILMKGKAYFTAERAQEFSLLAQTARSRFIDSFLKPFRDEAVHLNYLGTSVSQIALVTNCAGHLEVKLHTTFTDDGKELNLVEVFSTLLHFTIETIRSMILLLNREKVHRMGMPKRLDAEVHLGQSTFRVRDLIEDRA